MCAAFSHMLLQVALHDTVMQLSIVQQEFRAPPTRRMGVWQAGELCQSSRNGKHVDTNKSGRTLKSRSGIHLLCQKENLPAGVAYKNLAILSCAAILLDQLTRLNANLLKLRSRPGIAKLLPWSSGKHPNSVVYTRMLLVPRESRSFIYAKKIKRNVYCQVCFAMKLSCWQHRAAFIFFLVNARTSV